MDIATPEIFNTDQGSQYKEFELWDWVKIRQVGWNSQETAYADILSEGWVILKLSDYGLHTSSNLAGNLFKQILMWLGSGPSWAQQHWHHYGIFPFCLIKNGKEILEQ